MQLFVNHLSNVDCSCLDPEFGLIGASWIVDIILEGELDHQGMIMDFGDVKKHIKDTIDNSIDHTLLIPTNCPNITVNKKDSSCDITYRFSKGKIEHSSPLEAVSLLDTDTITMKFLETFLEQIIAESLSENGLSARIMLREEVIEGASYVYSHGLKQHEGNCQRIAHGHRSQIRIIQEGTRSEELEKSWSDRWHGQYLANQIDVKKTYTEDSIDYTVFAYNALQGAFELTIPTACCSFINDETTVEHLAQYICDTLSNETGKKLRVFAYEGVNKGAIAETTESSHKAPLL